MIHANPRSVSSVRSAMMLTGACLAGLIFQTSTASAQGVEAENEDTVVVTGIRRSLESALETKREANSIVDGISADGIGRFPDLNLAESLQRVTGVQINRRDEQRVGTIALRGLGGGFVRTEVNGQILATPGGGTNFPFGILQSDVVSAVEVIKSPTAANDAGGVAGIVNIKTASALDLRDDFTLTGQVEAQHEELSGETLPSVSVSLGKKFANDTIGFISNISWEETNFRRDSVNINGYTECEINTPLDRECFPEEGFDDDVTNNIFIPRQLRNIVRQSDGTRFSVSGGVDWRPTDRFEMSLKGLFSDFDLDDEQLFYRFRLQDGSPGVITEGGVGNDYRLLADPIPSAFGFTAAAVEIPNTRARFDSRFYNDVWTTGGLTFDTKYEADDWVVSGAIAFSTAERDRAAGRFNVEQRNSGVGTIITGGASDDSEDVLIDNEFPDFLRSLEANGPYAIELTGDGRACDIVGVSRPEFDGRAYGIETCLDNDFVDEQEEFAIQADFRRDLNFSFFRDFELFESVQFGMKYRNTQFANIGFTDTSIEGANLGAISDEFLRPIGDIGGADFFNGKFDNVDVEDFLYIDQFALIDALGPFTPIDDPLYSPNRLGFNRTLDPGDNFELERDIIAGYFMVNLGGEILNTFPIRGNVGFRVEHTDRTAQELFGNPNDSVPFNDEPQSAGLSYTNVLPIANLIVDLREDLILRLAYSDTILRPGIGSTRAGTTFNVPGDPDDLFSSQDTISIGAGAPDLVAQEIRGYDASLEWYNRSGSAITFAFFRKEIQNRIIGGNICPEDGGGFGFGPLRRIGGTCILDNGSDRIISINVTDNSGEGFNINGFEVAATQNLDFLPGLWSNFGGTVNYTFIDAAESGEVNELTGRPIPLNNISENTFNVIGYYETDLFGIRLAYNYRDEYFAQSFGSSTGGDRKVSNLGRLDLSSQLNVTENLQLGFEAFNLTDEIIREFQDVESRVRRRDVDGRTFVLSARYRF